MRTVTAVVIGQREPLWVSWVLYNLLNPHFRLCEDNRSHCKDGTELIKRDRERMTVRGGGRTRSECQDHRTNEDDEEDQHNSEVPQIPTVINHKAYIQYMTTYHIVNHGFAAGTKIYHRR